GVGVGESKTRTYWAQQGDFTATPQVFAAPGAFRMAGIVPADVDVLACYDPFTIVSLMQIEDMGFCKKGEGGPFVEGTALHFDGGRLPYNTHGGMLSHAYVLGRGGARRARGAPLRRVPALRLVSRRHVSLLRFAHLHLDGGERPRAALLVVGRPPCLHPAARSGRAVRRGSGGDRGGYCGAHRDVHRRLRPRVAARGHADARRLPAAPLRGRAGRGHGADVRAGVTDPRHMCPVVSRLPGARARVRPALLATVP